MEGIGALAMEFRNKWSLNSNEFFWRILFSEILKWEWKNFVCDLRRVVVGIVFVVQGTLNLCFLLFK
jgi:hypothetical protein